MYSNDCEDTDRISIVDSVHFKQDFFLLNVFNSVYAVASALDSVVVDVCGQNYTGICDEFKSSDDIREMLMDKLEEVEFEDPSGAIFEFTDKRENQQGYTFYRFDDVGDATEVRTYDVYL